MLCFFPSLRDLEHCRGLAAGANKDVKVIHARKSAPGGGKSDWYGCIINSAETSDLATDVKSHFHSVGNNELRQAYDKGEEWGVCFDSLSRAATGVVADNCAFLLESVSWPPLEPSMATGKKSTGWEICEVRALSEILESLDLDHPETTEDWEVLQLSASEDGVTSAAPSAPNTAIEVAPPAPTRGTVRSYRDALLKSPAKTAASSGDADQARKKAATASTWRPTIVVQNVKYEHKDKLYQHNLVEQGIDPNALYNVEEEKDDGGYDGGSYFQSSEFAKGSVSVNRLRAATMLRPAALEKKMGRIAAKAAQRPPVPGASGEGGSGGGGIIRAAIAERNRHFSAAAAAGEYDDYSD